MHEVTREQAWSHYWSSGALHSLPSSFERNYGGAVGRFWTDIFSGLVADSRILDLCTGNGALPMLALEAGPDPLHIDAVDLAEIAPPGLGSCEARVWYHPRTNAEQLPFEKGAFDLVVSQYGIEYTDWRRAIAEAARVTVEDGRLALLVHHADSRLAHVAREEQVLIAWLLSPGAFLDRAAAIYPYIAQANGPERATLQTDEQANRVRAEFNAAGRELVARTATSSVPDILVDAREVIARLLEQARRDGDARTALAHHAAYRQALREGQLRAAELCTCALDARGIQAMVDACAGAGFMPEPARPIHHENGALMGWTLTATRKL